MRHSEHEVFHSKTFMKKKHTLAPQQEQEMSGRHNQAGQGACHATPV
eukprot:CAMPEP_0202389142 /NCGR_PEP_ID=MMETSP1127-20130417/81289_1 /ASSEMBLY_ACC=CAM_ASM_000462 /TAXON_ID=3047 /ORGANISM="Dunaliella tertiolecta, Strain CCMP1320" /LENGTH=46 /DNA_ID= /DNA_START= /DNA_END= /DNA_ORIENTATION=